MSVDAKLRADFFKMPVAEIMKEIFSSAVTRILETLRHHLGRREMPEVNRFWIVAAKEKIKPSVSVIVEPDSRVRIDPSGQASLLRDARKAMPRVVMKKFGLAPFVKKEVFVAVVIIIAPDRAHRDARARLIH